MRLPIHLPEFLRGSPPRPRLHGLAPVTLLALLKHPLLRLDLADRERAVAALERAILRGPRPRAGTHGLAHALETFRESKDSLHRSDPRHALTDAELAAAADLVARLGRCAGAV